MSCVSPNPNKIHTQEERHDLSAANPDVVQRLWAKLNSTNLELYGPDHSPPSLLGHCDKACASKYYDGKSGPECGVPGC